MWGAFRGLWGFFWTFLVLELFALVQLGRGLWGDLGADKMARYEKLAGNIEKRKQQAEEAVSAGDQASGGCGAQGRGQSTEGGGQGACRSRQMLPPPKR